MKKTRSYLPHPLASLVVACVASSLGCGSGDDSSESADGVTATEPEAPAADDPAPAADTPPVASPAADAPPVATPEPGADTPPVGDPEPATDVLGDADASGEVCARDERLGSLRVYLGEDRTVFTGAVSNGVAPAAIPDVLAASGSCELVGPRSLFCSTPCESGQTCAGDDTCVPTPQKVSVGSLSLTGLLAEVEVSPNGITSDYSKTIMDPFPGFEPGAAIQITAAGEDSEAFTMGAWGVAKLDSPERFVQVAPGSGVTLEWDATAANPAQSQVAVTFTVNAHGATTGWIECTAEDTGSFEIPEPLVTQLIELGLSGFPRVSLARRSTDTVALPGGCVDFQVSSDVTLELEIDGLISCNTSEDCPDGQSCSPELACGEGA